MYFVFAIIAYTGASDKGETKFESDLFNAIVSRLLDNKTTSVYRMCFALARPCKRDLYPRNGFVTIKSFCKIKTCF
jgi:hypothetical protein